MARLFALGTLKRRFPLCYALEGSQYLGPYRSVERFPLVIAGPWYSPMLLDEAGHGRHILGELYEVNETTLARIDGLESVGQPGNFRITVRVTQPTGTEECEAFAYAKAPELATPVHSGYLAEYHDRRFIPPWERLERAKRA
jgi:gamma-glutamylaminecyclotransferase